MRPCAASFRVEGLGRMRVRRRRGATWSARAVAVAVAVGLVASLLGAVVARAATGQDNDPVVPASVGHTDGAPATTEMPKGDFSHPPLGPTERADRAKNFDSKAFDEKSAKTLEESETRLVEVDKHGLVRAEATSVPVRAKNGNAWKRIDLDLEEAGNGRSRPKVAAVDIELGATPDEAAVIGLGDGNELTLSVADGPDNRSAERKKDKHNYAADTRPAVEVSARPSGVETTYVLPDASFADAALRESVTLPRGFAARQGAGGIELLDGSGAVRALWGGGVALDSSEKPGPQGVTVTLERVSGRVATARVEVDAAWLHDPARVYPVRIDPTIYAQSWSGVPTGDAYIWSTNPNQQGWNSPTLYAGPYGPGGVLRSVIGFDPNVPPNSDVVTSELHLWETDGGGTPPGSVGVRRNDTAFDPSVTWATAPVMTDDAHQSVVPADTPGDQELVMSIPYYVEGWVGSKHGMVAPNFVNGGVTLFADNELTGTYGFHQFHSNNTADPNKVPKLVIYYESTPALPTPLTPADGITSLTTTPLLQGNTAAPTYAGDTVLYSFIVATEPDGETGMVSRSGWFGGPGPYNPEEGTLTDGATYYWKMVATEVHNGVWLGVSRGQVRKFTVNKRLGSGSPSPYDQYGPAAVNLATGNLSYSLPLVSAQTLGGPMGMSLDYNSAATPPSGLQAKYFFDEDRGRNFNEGVALSRVDPRIDFDWNLGSPSPALDFEAAAPGDWFSAQWRGYVKIPTSGTWQFGVTHDDGARIFVNGTNTLSDAVHWQDQGAGPIHWGNAVSLSNSNYTQFGVDYYEATGGASIHLYARDPSGNVASVPPGWLSTDSQTVSPGWSASADLDGSIAYTSARDNGGSVVLRSADGSTSEYKATGSGFTPPPGEDGVLSRDQDSTLTFRDTDGLTYKFNVDGTLKSVVSASDDRKPAALVYTWSAATAEAPPRLTKIEDPVSGRNFTFLYNFHDAGSCVTFSPPDGRSDLTQGPKGSLCGILQNSTDIVGALFYAPADGTATAGVLRYASVREPGFSSVPSIDTEFGYYGDGRLRTIRDSRARDAIKALKADNDDRSSTVIDYQAAPNSTAVARVTLPAPLRGGSRPSHTYTAGTTATVREADGSANGALIRTAYSDTHYRMTSSTDEAGVTTQTAWNTDDLVTSTIDGAGLKSTTIYDYAKRPTASYGPAPQSCFAGDVPNGCAAGVPETTMTYDEGMIGLAAAYWDNNSFTGSPKLHATGVASDGRLVKDWGYSAPSTLSGISLGVVDNWSARFTGEIQFPAAGWYQLDAYSDDGVRVWVDDVLVTQRWMSQAFTKSDGVTMVKNATAGSWHRIRVDYYDNIDPARLELHWSGPGVASGPVPGASLRPRYGLTTKTVEKVQTGDFRVTSSNFGSEPELGIAQTTTVDPFSLNLRTAQSFEPRSTTTYLRRLTKTMPRGVVTTGVPNDYQTAYAYYVAGDSSAGTCSAADAAAQLGLLKTATNPAGLVTRYVYDRMGRVTGTQTAGGGWACQTRDSRGRVVTDTASDGKTSTFSYNDSADPLVTDVSYADSASATRTTRSTTDLLGRLIAYRDEHGTVTTTTFDQRGRVVAVDRTLPGQSTTVRTTENSYNGLGQRQSTTDYVSGGPRTTTYTYDGAGRLTTTTPANGVVTTTSYDPNRGTPIGIKHEKAGSPLSNWSYARFLNGAISNENESVTGRSHYFNYDSAGRLTLVNNAQGGAIRQYAYDENSNRCGLGFSCDANWAYDTADRITKSPYASSYGYDARGNNTTTAVTGSAGTNYVNQGRAYNVARDGSSWTIPMITWQVGQLNATLDWANAGGTTATSEANGALSPGASATPELEITGRSDVTGGLTWTATAQQVTNGYYPADIPGGSSTTKLINASAPGTITALASWPAVTKTLSQGGSISGTATTWNSNNMPVSSGGGASDQVCVRVTWSGTGMDMDFELRTASGVVMSSTELLGSSEPASGSKCYSVPAMSYPSSQYYWVRVIKKGLGGSFTVTATYPVSPSVDMVLKNSSGTTVATSAIDNGQRQRTLSYPSAPAGTYQLVLSSANEAVTASYYETHYEYVRPNMKLSLLGPAGSMLQTVGPTNSGYLSIRHKPSVAGVYKWKVENTSSSLSTNYTVNTSATTTLLDTMSNASLAPGAAVSQTLRADGPGPLVSDLSWGQGTQQVGAGPSTTSVSGGGSTNVAVNTSATGTVTASGSWPAVLKTLSPSGGSITGNATTRDMAMMPVSAGGGASDQVCVRVTWSGTGMDMDFELRTASGVVMSSTDLLGTSEPNSASPKCYQVPAMSHPSSQNYWVRVIKKALGGSFTVNATYPVSPSVDMVLKNSAGTTVATSSIVGGQRQRSLSYPSAPPGNYQLVLSSADETATVTYSETHWVSAWAPLRVRVYELPANTLRYETTGSAGSLSSEWAVPAAGDYRVEVTNTSTTGLTAPSLSVNTTVPRAGLFRAEVKDSVGSVLTSKQTNATTSGPLSLQWTTVAGGGYEVVVTPLSGKGLARVIEGAPGGTPARTITYDARDHATQVDDGQQVTQETLSPSGRVLERKVISNWAGRVLEHVLFGYANDGDSPAYTYNKDALATGVTTYLGGAGAQLVDTAGAAQWRHLNLHGDVVGTTDLAGNWTAATLADEFGRVAPGGAGWDGNGSWLGAHQRRVLTANTGLTRMGVRIYDPALGRFTSVDPIEGGCSNDYVYVNDPVNQFDLDGQASSGDANSPWCKHSWRHPSRANQCRLARRGANFASSHSARLATGGGANALRHCLWAAVMTMDMGASAAFGFLSRHERGSTDTNDTLIDWRNNRVGMRIGARSKSRKQILQRCRAALNSGQLDTSSGWN